MLLDIGAGQGLFSLAAAARGHRAIAFELSPNSLASFEASMAFNGFQDLITLHKVQWPLAGHTLKTLCVLSTGGLFSSAQPAGVLLGLLCQYIVYNGIM